MDYDVFISHASEDKDDFVRPLVRRLETRGLSVWYDETTLKLGDSITASINHGLAKSRYGIVVISHHFISKKWPQRELGALFAREDIDNKKILPVWHNITVDEIKQHYPLLADLVAVQSAEGMDVVIRSILEVVNPDLNKQKTNAISRLADLSRSIEYYLAANLQDSNRAESELRDIATQAQKSVSILAKALNEIARTGDVNEVILNLITAEKLITETLMYCPKCSAKKSRVVNARTFANKSEKVSLYGKCPDCGTGMYKIGV